jgi:hypothetical protein
VIADSMPERRRLRLLDAMGEEVARVSGVLIGPDWVEEEGEPYAALFLSERAVGDSEDPAGPHATACTINREGTMIGTLPSGRPVSRHRWPGTS